MSANFVSFLAILTVAMSGVILTIMELIIIFELLYGIFGPTLERIGDVIGKTFEAISDGVASDPNIQENIDTLVSSLDGMFKAFDDLSKAVSGNDDAEAMDLLAGAVVAVLGWLSGLAWVLANVADGIKFVTKWWIYLIYLFNRLVDSFRMIYDAVVEFFVSGKILDAIVGAFKSIGDNLKKEVDNIVRNAPAFWAALWGSIASAFKIEVDKAFQMPPIFNDFITKMDSLKTSFEKVIGPIQSVIDQIMRFIPWGDSGEGSEEGSGSNSGEDSGNFIDDFGKILSDGAANLLNSIPHFANGGIFTPQGQSGLAVLHAGEGVLTNEAMNMIGGESTLNAINSGARNDLDRAGALANREALWSREQQTQEPANNINSSSASTSYTENNIEVKVEVNMDGAQFNGDMDENMVDQIDLAIADRIRSRDGEIYQEIDKIKDIFED